MSYECRLTGGRSVLWDPGPADSLLRFANRQTDLQGALLTASRALSLTLTEYL